MSLYFSLLPFYQITANLEFSFFPTGLLAAEVVANQAIHMLVSNELHFYEPATIILHSIFLKTHLRPPR